MWCTLRAATSAPRHQSPVLADTTSRPGPARAHCSEAHIYTADKRPIRTAHSASPARTAWPRPGLAGRPSALRTAAPNGWFAGETVAAAGRRPADAPSPGHRARHCPDHGRVVRRIREPNVVAVGTVGPTNNPLPTAVRGDGSWAWPSGCPSAPTGYRIRSGQTDCSGLPLLRLKPGHRPPTRTRPP
jgi:hypothetical protein